MTPEVVRVPDTSSLFQKAADEFVKAVNQAVKAKGRFDVALSGGSTPKGLFALLTRNPDLPWGSMRFFWGDERHVPPGHPDSNYRMANESLLSKIGAKPEQVFRILGEKSDAAEAATLYEAQLRTAFGLAPGQLPAFDLVMLGMGSEGHTASLFPGTTALNPGDRLVVSTWVGKLFTDRITLTAPVINHAALVMFMVSGSDKALALKGVLEGPYEPAQLPAQLIKPENGRLLWIVEQSAAAMLK